MARVPLRSYEDLPLEDRELVWRRGNLYKALANSPEFAARFAAFGFWMNYASRIDLRMQELVILQISYLLKSKFEWSAHIRKSREANIVSEAEILAIKAETTEALGIFCDVERAAIQMARDIVLTRKAATDSYATIRVANSDAYMVDLAGLIGMYVGLAHTIEVLEIDLTPEQAAWLESHPIDAS